MQKTVPNYAHTNKTHRNFLQNQVYKIMHTTIMHQPFVDYCIIRRTDFYYGEK